MPAPTDTRTSPRIKESAWGEILIQGYKRPFRDVKLFPGGACEWDWRVTGTQHSPGIQPADVQELIDNGATVVILAQGRNLRLEVQDQTLDMLRAQGIDAEVMPTAQAIDRYNELATAGQAVGALIHTTC